MEKKIIQLLSNNGPLTGNEIREKLYFDNFELWKFCKLSDKIFIKTIGRQYLRLDVRIKNYARLSPSILREFLSYSLIGLSDQKDKIDMREKIILNHIDIISKLKISIADEMILNIRKSLANEWKADYEISFILAGDIVYNMAHNEKRPERSTGKIVKGSDIDIVVVLNDDVPDHFMKKLDEKIYNEKYKILVNPYINQEIDYVVKKVVKVKEQMKFDSIKHMIACKILHEGVLLYGSKNLFNYLKELLKVNNINDRLDDLEKRARQSRESSIKALLKERSIKKNSGIANLFYSVEESEEFE